MRTAERPNILLICTDHLSGANLGCSGHPVVQTPTIDQLAARGVRFTNAYSACPVCVPARRTLMTGLSARGHGARHNTSDPMPDAPTLAACFRNAGYQTTAIGKLHVSPQRDRIGFDDAWINEEGRMSGTDDWEIFLRERGYTGQEYAVGGTQNDYVVTPWHLPEDCHQTAWAGREMCRAISRKDPTRPAFWYLSFAAPHPPLWPTPTLLDQYHQRPCAPPAMGQWSRDFAIQPPTAAAKKIFGLATSGASNETIIEVRRAFYAMITHIDQQIRVVLGTLREQGLLANTLIALTSDHGDMLGDHGMWGKAVFYESSAKVPLIVVPPATARFNAQGSTDNRLAELQDLMPTLLDSAGIPVPDGVEGENLFAPARREFLFGELGNGNAATRMIREGDHKLIYYAEGNRFQLFNLAEDPTELYDLAAEPSSQSTLQRLQNRLADSLYGDDTAWFADQTWTGLPPASSLPSPDAAYGSQRGIRTFG